MKTIFAIFCLLGAPCALASVTTKSIVSPHPGFLWDPTVAFEEYDVIIASDPDFEDIIDKDRIANIARYVPAKPLLPGNYFFRVFAGGQTVSDQAFSISKPDVEISITAGSGMPEIRDALAKAQGATSVIIRFEPGEYRVSPGSGGSLFVITSTENLIIDGNGAHFVIEDIASIAEIRDSKHITLRNFSIDYDTPVFTAARVESLNADGKMKLRLLPGYAPPESIERFMEEQRGMFYDPELPRMAEDVPLLVYMKNAWEKTDDGSYELEVKDPADIENVRPGMRYICAPRHETQGFEIQHCEDVTLADITTYFLPGIGISTVFAEDLKLIGLQFLRHESRLLGSQNGGTNLHNARIGPWMEGCRFENTGDDCNHINALVMTAVRQNNARELEVANSLPGVKLARKDLSLRLGDRLAFFDLKAGAILTQARIESLEASNHVTRVRLDRDIPNIVLGNGQNFPPLDATQIYNIDGASGRFAFRDNVFLNGRRTGLLAKSGPGLIEGNRFEELGGGGIEIFNAKYEGLLGEEILIRKNIFRRGGLVFKKTLGPGHALWVRVFESKKPQAMHHAIRFIDNEIIDYPGDALNIANVTDLHIERNRFMNQEPVALRITDPRIIRLTSVKNGVIAGNIFEDKRFDSSSHFLMRQSSGISSDLD